MLGRYAELKAQLPPGTILFYQVGTFFETFEEDAKTISRELSIRLTSREAAGEGRVPLAGGGREETDGGPPPGGGGGPGRGGRAPPHKNPAKQTRRGGAAAPGGVA